MTTLTLQMLQNAPQGVFNVNTDYYIADNTLSVPANMTFNFSSGGSISGHTIVFNHTTIIGTLNHAIISIAKGTIANSIVYMSWFANVNNVEVEFANQTVNYDEDATIENTVYIHGNNVIFDGMGNDFFCNASFFSNQGYSNITIKNFNATANRTNTNLVFYEMHSINHVHIQNIQVYNNVLNNFKIGISLNNDEEDASVSYSNVYNNHITFCPGHDSGLGYGIHLANVKYCTVSDNEVVNCGRHAIYHAYGEYNTISDNIIREHCQDLTDYRLLAALEIGRKSKNVTVENNTFVNCNNVCLLIYSPMPSNDNCTGNEYHWRYGKCENIIVQNNRYYKGNLNGTVGNYPFIYIGVQNHLYSELSAAGNVVKNVTISGNLFEKVECENQKCVLVYQCEILEISGNTFQLGLPLSPQSNRYLVIHIPSDHISGFHTAMTVAENTFKYFTPGHGNLYLIGEDMTLINTINSPDYTIAWTSNTYINRYLGGIERFKRSQYTPGNNFTISQEPTY